jgi:hypothetical protein
MGQHYSPESITAGHILPPEFTYTVLYTVLVFMQLQEIAENNI